jgi:hypothetical protein
MNKYPLFNSDDDEPIKLKYKIGDKIAGIAALEDYTFTFTFDYLSLNSSNLCFNNNDVSREDFVKIFSLKKKLSKMKIEDIQNKRKRDLHFHSIDLNEKRFLKEPLKNLFGYSRVIEADRFPTIYQIAVYTDNELEKAPRIVGFFGNYGVFHVLWLDYHHQIYRGKK